MPMPFRLTLKLGTTSPVPSVSRMVALPTAQITGLNAASKNVKDGISLVKTAEGAMQEIQDMLNRMDSRR